VVNSTTQFSALKTAIVAIECCLNFAFAGMKEVAMYLPESATESWAENVKNMIWFFTKGPGKFDKNYEEYLNNILS
jgi:hypothetical protein